MKPIRQIGLLLRIGSMGVAAISLSIPCWSQTGPELRASDREVRRTAFVAEQQIALGNEPEKLALAAFIVEARKIGVPTTAIGPWIEEAIERFDIEYKRGAPPPSDKLGLIGNYDAQEGMWNVLSAVASERPGGATVFAILNEAKKYHEANDESAQEYYRVNSLLQKFLVERQERQDRTRVFEELYDRIGLGGDLAMADLVKQFFSDPNMSAAERIDNNPALSQNQAIIAIRARIGPDGELVIPIDELNSLFPNEMRAMTNIIADQTALLAQLATNQAALYQYMTNAAAQTRNQELIQAAQAREQQQIEAAKASFYILGTLVGFNNPEMGRQIQIVGGSTVQIADALRKFADADDLESVILTGNVLGAVMNVVGMFGSHGPSPDEQILAAIAQLRMMIHQLREEMHERFDRVDKKLEAVYETMTDRFDRIDLQLGILNGDIQEIQRTLFSLQADIYRLEGKTFGWINAIGRRDLNEALNGSIDYRLKFGQPIPADAYLAFENKYFTWAVSNSRDEVESGYLNRSYEDSALFTELTTQPLENNVSFLAELIRRRYGPFGLPSFAEPPIANPRDWAIAASAWLELTTESPMLYRRLNLNRVDTLASVGFELQNALARITLTQSGESKVANLPLFALLLADYRAKADAFVQALRAKEREFRLGLSPNQSKRPAFDALDLWGGAVQPTSWRPPLQTMSASTDGSTHGVIMALPLPKDWEQLVPQECFLADLIGAGALSFSWGNYDFSPRIAFSTDGDDYGSATRHFSSFYGEIGSFDLSMGAIGTAGQLRAQ